MSVELLADSETAFEHELVWHGGRAIPIEPLGTIPGAPRGKLPELLLEYAALAERAAMLEDLDATCGMDDARELTRLAWQRAHVLVDAGAIEFTLPADIMAVEATLSAPALVDVLARVVASGFAYDEGTARLITRRSPRLLATIARTLVELRAGAAVRVARRALGKRPRPAVCRHYAAALQTLFFAVKRATGAYERSYLAPITGRAFVSGDVFHAWNLLVDASTRTLVAVDATKGSADAVPRRHHVSGLLAAAICESTAAGPLYEREEVAKLACAAIEPTTDRGLQLLFHIADFFMTGAAVREQIATHLAAHDFARLVADWRARLDHRSRTFLGRISSSYDGTKAISRLPLVG